MIQRAKSSQQYARRLAISGWLTLTQAIVASQPVGAQAIAPTDTVPLISGQKRTSLSERLQFKALERLPQRFYFNASVESTFRLETNPFQYPMKRTFLSQISAQAPPPIFQQLDTTQQQQAFKQLKQADKQDLFYRVVPNVTAGWALTPATRIYGNYFAIADSAFHEVQLSTVAQSISGGVERDIWTGRKTRLQADGQFREFFAKHSQPVFDFLPSLTLSYAVAPNITVFTSALLQLRGKQYFQAPTKEIDPFYTIGAAAERGPWMLTSSGTFVQNFREPFGRSATIPLNEYTVVLDCELARRITQRIPGLQALVRAEPIYNLHTHNRPGQAGMDFRLYWGLRMAMGKPPMLEDVVRMRKQLEESQ